MNLDGVANNDLIYIPRDTSEMNFQSFTAGGRTYTAAEQAQRSRRSSSRTTTCASTAASTPSATAASCRCSAGWTCRSCRICSRTSGARSTRLQVRFDIQNFTNLLNDKWGVMWRPVASVNTNQQMQVLTDPSVDAQGRSTYRLARVGTDLIRNTYQTSATTDDVYQFMVTLRYGFN